AAAGFGAVVGVLNEIGVGALVQKLPKGKLLSLAARIGQGLTEAGTEYAEEPAEAVARSLAHGRPEDIPSAVLESLKNVDVIPGSFLLGASGSVRRAVDLQRQAGEAKSFAGDQIQVGELVKDSKLKQRSPDALAEVLEQTGFGEEAWITPEGVLALYGQADLSGQKGDELLQALGVDPKSAMSAMQLNQDLQVKASDLHAHLTPEQFAELAQDLRSSPQAMTLRESGDEAMQARVREVAELAKREAQEETDYQTERDRLRQEVLDTGKVDPEQAEAWLSTLDGFASRWAGTSRDRVELLRKIRAGGPQSNQQNLASPLSALPDDALTMAVEASGSDPVYVPLIRFTPEEREILRKAGIVETVESLPDLETGETTPYEAARLDPLFEERERRHKNRKIPDAYTARSAAIESLKQRIARYRASLEEMRSESLLRNPDQEEKLEKSLARDETRLAELEAEVEEANEADRSKRSQATGSGVQAERSFHQPLDPNVDQDAEIEAVQTAKEESPVWSSLKGVGAKKILDALPHALVNDFTGLTFDLSRKHARHMISSAASRGLGGEAHIAAVRTIEPLMKVAVPEKPVADQKDQEDVKAVQRFYAPMLYGDAVYTVSMLSKEYEGKRRIELEGVYKLYDLKLEKKTSTGLAEGLDGQTDEGLDPGDVFKEQAPAGLAKGPGEPGAFTHAGAHRIKIRTMLEGVKGSDGEPLLLDEPQTYLQASSLRGSLAVTDQGYLISLLQSADFSTIMHETGHFFLEEMGALIRSGQASESMVRDYELTRSWMATQAAGVLGELQAEVQQAKRAYNADKSEANRLELSWPKPPWTR
ncbi:MAG: hypothetical protein AB7D27_17865, partial [Desulfomicrobium sp.]